MNKNSSYFGFGFLGK